MNNNQMTCDPERIELFLGQKLSDEEQTAFESHLDDCVDCRHRLESAAAGEDIWSGVRDSLPGEQLASDRHPPGDSALDSATGGEGSFSHAAVLNLLAPTDDDRMIGRLGTYEVVGVIGSGGMGVVLKAFDAALNRYVAIKVLAPHLGSSGAARKRFSREAQAAAAVVHDNVIEIHGVADADGLPYLVMPYVPGPSLQRRLDREGPLALVEILRIGMQAASGLAAAHAQGLVHRDVKPANILLADGVERVKLTDFGLARAADDASLTKTGIIAGTPQYMSPEQARGETVDQRSDLFSLGSALYAMCTGRAPFRAETSYGVLRRITDEEPRPIRELNPEIPDWLAAIIGKLHAKEPADRFQSASQVADLLGEWLAHLQQPTSAPRPRPVMAPQSAEQHTNKRGRVWMAGLGAAAILIAAVVFFVRLGETTVQFEIDDPALAVRFGEREITVDNDGDTIRIRPGAKNEFTVLQNGAEVVGRSIELKKGDKITLRVTVAGNGGIDVRTDPKTPLSIRDIALPVFGQKRDGDAEMEVQFMLNGPRDAEFTSRRGKPMLKLPGKLTMRGRTVDFTLTRIPDNTGLTLFGSLHCEHTNPYPEQHGISLEITPNDIRMASRDCVTKYIYLVHQRPHKKYVWQIGILTMGRVDAQSDREVRKNLKEHGSMLAVFQLQRRAPDQASESPEVPLWNEFGVTPAPVSPLTAKVLEWIGVRLEPIAKDRVRGKNIIPGVDGGLDVTFVRPDGPAAKAGINEVDIVVGLQGWAIIALKDLDFAMRGAVKKIERGDADSFEFLVLCDGKIVSVNIPFPVGQLDLRAPGSSSDSTSPAQPAKARAPKASSARPAEPGEASLWNEFGVTPAPVSPLTAKVLEWIGLHLEPIAKDRFREKNVLAKYAGGLKVALARTNGTVERAGIHGGYIVVGLQGRPIAGLEDLDIAMHEAVEQIERRDADSLQFDVLRSGKTVRVNVPFPAGQLDLRTPGSSSDSTSATQPAKARPPKDWSAPLAEPGEASLWNEFGVTPAPVSPLTARVLEWIGLHLKPIAKDRFRKKNVFAKYAGGLDVTFTRTGGPAAKAGINGSDIVVGIHEWEITALQDLDYAVRGAVEQIERGDADSLRFFVLRNGKIVRLNVPFPVGQLDLPTLGSDSESTPAALPSKPNTTTAIPKRARHFTIGPTGNNAKIAYSADGKRIAIANGNPTRIMRSNATSRVANDWKPSVDVLDAETGKIVVSLNLTTADQDAVLAATERISHVEATALAFSPDGNVVAVGTSIGQLKLFDVRTGELLRALDDEQAKLADKETPEDWKPLRRAMGSVRSLAFSPDGSRLAMCGGSFADFAERFDAVERMGFRAPGPGRLKLWNVQTGALEHDLAGHNNHAYAVAFSPDGRLLASAGHWMEKLDSWKNRVILWDVHTGYAIRGIRTTASRGTHSVAFSPDSKLLAIGTKRFDESNPNDPSTGGVSLVHVASGPTQWLVTVPGWAKRLAFSPDGKSIAVLCGGRSIRFLETATGALKHEIRPADPLQDGRWNDFAIAPQAGRLAIGGVDHERKGTLEVWDFDRPRAAADSAPEK